MTAREVLANIEGFAAYDIMNYPLCEREAKVVAEALKLLIEKEERENGPEFHVRP